MHAEAALNCRTSTLVGVGGREGTGAELSRAARVPTMDLETMIAASDALVIATPPDAVAATVEVIGDRVGALLIEAPLPASFPTPGVPAMIGANLLHAPIVRAGLAAIERMEPHHLQLRSTMPRPSWGTHDTEAYGGPLLDPGARLLPVLLAAAGSSVIAAEQHDFGPDGATRVTLELGDGRTVEMRSQWVDGSATAELEAADATGVVHVSFFPTPRLEVDGRPADADDTAAANALGFVNQIDRLARVARGQAEPWLPLSSGQGVRLLLDEVSGDAG